MFATFPTYLPQVQRTHLAALFWSTAAAMDSSTDPIKTIVRNRLELLENTDTQNEHLMHVLHRAKHVMQSLKSLLDRSEHTTLSDEEWRKFVIEYEESNRLFQYIYGKTT